MSKLLAILALLCAFAVQAKEFNYSYGNVTLLYAVVSEGEKTCKVYRNIGCSASEVVIPSEANEYKVVEISDQAFVGCNAVKQVSIPNSVRVIGRSAFTRTGLTSVAIPESVHTICEGAFSGCTGLTSVSIPNSVNYIGKYAFSGCTGLAAVTIPTSVTSIEEKVFYGCTGLTTVNIPNSVTHIYGGAFSGCTGLTTVNIPNSVTYIYGGAFSGCASLTSVNIPASVTDMDTNYNPFANCSNLREIKVDKQNIFYSDVAGILFNKKRTMLLAYPAGCKYTVYSIPSSVEYICGGAFEGCTGLTSVILPPSVTTIEEKVFRGCTGLTSVAIPSRVTSIGESAFRGCTGLTAVSLPTSVTSIGGYAFEGCTNLSSVPLTPSVYYIGDGAFRGCTSFVSVNIPSSVTSIGEFTFAGCTGLTSLKVPTSVTSIGKGAFSNCLGLTFVSIPPSVTEMGGWAFDGCDKLSDVRCNIPNPIECTYPLFGKWTYANATLTVPIGAKEKYVATQGWQQFVNIVEEEMDGIEEIEADEVVTVYDLGGNVVRSGCKRNELGDLPKGVYVVTNGCRTTKVAIK